MKLKQYLLLICTALASGITSENVDARAAGTLPESETTRPDEIDRREVLDLPNRRSPARWQWLEGSYWYVPQFSLTAYVFDADANELVKVTDQTVFHITGYNDGYFWGKTVVSLGLSFKVSCMSLVGSVTPEGDVLLTFTPVDPDQSTAPTQGIGTMRFVPRFGGWTMENQMSSGPTSRQVNHWAYMVQSYPGERSWESLPGRGIPIPRFLARCHRDGPQKIGD